MWCPDGTVVVTSVAAGALFRVWPDSGTAERIARHERRRERRRARGRRLDPRHPERRHRLLEAARASSATLPACVPAPSPACSSRRPTAPSPTSPTTASTARTISRSRPTAPCTSPTPATSRRPKTATGRVMVYDRDGTRAHVRRRLLLLQRHRVRARRHRRRGRAARPAARARRRRARVGRSRSSAGAAATASASTPTAASTSRRPSSTASASSTPTARSSTSCPIEGEGLTTNCCFGGDDLRTLFVTDAIPGNLVAFEGMPDARPPAPDLARPRLTPRYDARRRAARSRAHCSGSSSGQPFSGRSKYSTLSLPAVVERARARASTAAKSTTPRRVVDVQLRVPGLALAQLHVIGELEQLARIAAPVGDVTGVDEQPHVAGTSARNARTVSIEFTTAPAHGSSSAPRRGAPPAHRPLPRAVELARSARASRTTRSTGFGNAVGHPIGSASVAGSVPTSGSMCSKPSACAARARARRRRRAARRRRRRRPSGHRNAAAASTSPSTSASPCRPAAGAGRGSCRSSRRPRPRVQPPSLPHPRDLLRVLEQRVREVGAAEDLAVHVRGAAPTRGTRRAAR